MHNNEYFKEIAHSNKKQTQLITHKILNATSKINSVWLWQHPNLDQYNTKTKKQVKHDTKVTNRE